MGNEEIKIIHLDSEKSWRGGQQQAAYLFSEMVRRKYPTLFICQPDSEMHQYCLKTQLPCKTVRMLGELDLIAGLRIAHIARKSGYDLIHAHSAHALATAIWAKFFYPRIRIFATRRVDFPLRKNLFSRWKYKTSLVEKIACTSYGIEEVLLGEGVPGKKLLTIHSGLDVHKFDNAVALPGFRERYGIPSENLIVGTVAALVGHKDYPNLLKAAKYVTDRFKNVTFAAIGSGNEEAMLKKLHLELDLGNQFIFLGFQKNVGAYLKHFDIFVLASRKEGIGGVLFEAQSVGLPVIGTSVGGIPEVIAHGRNGLLVPPGDHLELGKAILELLKNKELRSDLSRNALIDFKKFDVNVTIDKYLELYREIIQ